MGKIRKNSIILVAKEGLLNISAIFVVGYMARKLGPDDYGKFAYSISFATILSFISNLGLRQYVTREIVRHKDKAKELYGQMFFGKLILAALMFFIGFGSDIFLDDSMSIWIIVGIALTSKFFFALTTNNYVIFEANEDMKYNAFTQTTGRIVVIILTVITLFLGFGLYTVAMVYLIGDMVQFFISYYFVNKNFFKPSIEINVKKSFDLIVKSFPFALFSIFYLIYFEVSKPLLFQLSSPQEVGFFQAAAVLAYKLLIISDAVGTAIFPKIVELAKNNASEYRILSFKAIGFMLGLGLVCAIGIFIYADTIIRIIYHSEEYYESIQILKIIVWAIPLMFLGKILSFLLIAQDNQRVLIGIYLSMVVILLITNWILVPNYAAVGAAWATLLAEITGLFLFIIFSGSLGLRKKKLNTL